jgi:hypothetical protein
MLAQYADGVVFALSISSGESRSFILDEGKCKDENCLCACH